MGSSRPKILGAYLTERLSVYDCPESCGADFSGPCGVAQSARVGAGGLLVHGGLPENGNLRLGATNATSSSLGSGQHRRRVSSAWESGQSTLYEYGRGFAGGESLLLDPGERPWIWRHQQSHNFTGRSQPLAQRLCVCHSGFGLLTADFHIPQGYQGRSPCLVRSVAPLSPPIRKPGKHYLRRIERRSTTARMSEPGCTNQRRLGTWPDRSRYGP